MSAKRCYEKGPLCSLPASKVCETHGPVFRKGRPWFETAYPRVFKKTESDPGLTVLPSAAARWAEVLKFAGEKMPAAFEMSDPWSMKLRAALDVDFSGRTA